MLLLGFSQLSGIWNLDPCLERVLRQPDPANGTLIPGSRQFLD
jgi:hypothetical protein